MIPTLRPWHIDDLESLVKYANNKKIADNMTDQFPNPYSIEDGKKFIAMATANTPQNILAIEINGEAIGGIGIHPQTDVHRMNAEMGYWLGEKFWGKGIVTSAIEQMLAYAFKNFEVNRIFARPYGTNSASQRVLKKAGFKLEGRFEKTLLKNGKLLDEVIFAVRR